jgi:hypothetical protein
MHFHEVDTGLEDDEGSMGGAPIVVENDMY